MAWKKVVLRGDNATTEQLLLDEEEVVAADDSIAFVDDSDSNYIKRESIVDFANKIAGDALDTDNDGVIDLSVVGLTANTINDTNNDLVLVWDHTESAWTTASLADVGSAGTSGVTSLSATNGLSVNASTGAVTVQLDTTQLSDTTVSSTTEFIVSNSDVEGVEAAGDISLGVFSNSSTNFIALTNLSVGTDAAASGSGGIAYNDTSGVFTYPPPDLSSYLTSDKYASSWSWTGGTTAGPTGTLTITNGDDVAFGAIPSAASNASGVVTTGDQTFAGNKTFNNNVIVTGDLTVNGTTTTINTSELHVEDKLIKIADVASPDTTSANGAGIQVEASATEAEWPEFKWSNSGDLSGWTLSNYKATSNTDYPVALMEFGSTAPSGTPEAGNGLFFADTTNNNLYIYI